MRETAFPWRFLSEPTLALHATGALPAWLWSVDGRKLLWANPGGAAIFGAETCAASIDRDFEASHPAATQIAAIAANLPVSGTPRLQRLRGFGTGFGRMLTCICSRVTHDDAAAVLIVAAEPAGPRLSLAERAQRLFEGCDEPVAVYAAHHDRLGELLFATPGADTQLADSHTPPTPALPTEKLGQGDSEVRYARLPQAVSRPDAAAQAGHPELIDLSPIADAISEAQKAMAIERAVHEEARTTATADTAAATNDNVLPTVNGHDTETIAAPDHTPAAERRHPMRFVWKIDSENRFSIEAGDFIEMIGPGIAAELNRPWISIAADLHLDAEGAVARAIASHDTWSGVTIDWPVDDSDERIAVELAGLPVYDRDRTFRGYRGFGVCRDLTRIAALLATRQRREASPPEAAAASPIQVESDAQAEIAETRPLLSLVPASENVVPFRPLSNDNARATTLNPVEENAFQELATRLTAGLKSTDEVARGETPPSNDERVATETPATTPVHIVDSDEQRFSSPVPQQPEHGTVKRDRPLLDLLPVGVLIYRDANFFYANRAFLRWVGHDSVQDFAEAGGLDTFLIEQAGSKDQALRVASPDEKKQAMTGHLFSIPWNDSTAMMLVTMESVQSEHPAKADVPAPASTTGSNDLQKILDIATDGVVTFGRDGTILTANSGAEQMFGYDADQLTGLPFTNLFAADSTPLVRNLLQSKGSDKSRDVTARTRRGEMLPLQVSVAEIDSAAGISCAAFRNLSRWKSTERDLIAARKQAEAASSAKSDFLAKVSHEIRTPLNAIIGFSDVMMNERFGPIGNERYKEYLKDIHGSGTHLVSLVNDLLDLSKIEAGKLDLAFEPVNLNDLTQQTVALLQPQASRERIIIRTALTPELPPVVADARSVRQIVLNLLSNSIKFTGAGGQVILSTARTDHGEAVLRVRDTGIGMSDKDIATALEPFRQLATAARSDSHGSGLGLPLTKALVEANSARFSIKSAVNAGTLVEIVFPAVRAAE